MAIIFEKKFKNPEEQIVRQFTNCCGAGDKGTEFGVVCRGCWSPIEGYMEEGFGHEDTFRNSIDNPIIAEKFEDFLKKDYWDWNEWHEEFLAKLRS